MSPTSGLGSSHVSNAFPPHQQRQIRLQLAANLRAVISQRLLRRADGNGLVLAAEVMVVNAAIRDYIADDTKMNEIIKNIEKGHDTYGMQTFDQSLFDLLQQGLVSMDEAVKHATSPNDFKLRLSYQQG